MRPLCRKCLIIDCRFDFGLWGKHHLKRTQLIYATCHDRVCNSHGQSGQKLIDCFLFLTSTFSRLTFFPSLPSSFILRSTTMASDSSDSPLVLTPESTGVTADSGLLTPESMSVFSTNSVPSSPATRARRRQTAVYPNPPKTQNQNPFSKSAAKRESVMALGSIQHLQHYFTKTGLVAKKK